jgi:hypothetical protein
LSCPASCSRSWTGSPPARPATLTISIDGRSYQVSAPTLAGNKMLTIELIAGLIPLELLAGS